MSVQLQWTLDRSTSSVIGVPRSILHAATTDNVQVLAILACECFGNTIAMSPETIRKIEHSVVPTPQPAILAFLQASVGYSANDCVSQLGQSLAGLQFLGLAAALVTTLGPSKSGQTIQEMLASTAVEKTLLPTPRQVRDLISRIEPRCHASGFADDVAGWQILLNQAGPDWIRELSRYERTMWIPNSQGIKNLVDAFRQLRRVGNEDVTSVTVRTTTCSPWTIAFTKWCLGLPPSIVSDDGTPILEQPGCEVSLIVVRQGGQDCFDVTVHSSLKGPEELIGTQLDEMVTGMVCPTTYGQLLIQHYGFDNGQAARAVEQAMPYALRAAIDGFLFSAEAFSGRQMAMRLTNAPYFEQGIVEKVPATDDPVRRLRISPFPEDGVVSSTHALLFGSRRVNLRSLDEGVRVTDLPVVALHLRALKDQCRCGKCSGPNTRDYSVCRETKFLEDLSVVVADVLALSLFDCPESIRVSNVLIRPDRNGTHAFVKAIHTILGQGGRARCMIFSLLNWALQLVGHDVKQLEEKTWIMSSFKGQTVYPTIYQTQAYSRRGYLSLSWLPGFILYKGDVYSRAIGPEIVQRGVDPVTGICEEEVLEPRNLCPKMNVRWKVTPLENSLCLSLSLQDDLGRYSPVASCPTHVLSNLVAALLVEDCSHASDARLGAPDRFSAFTGPLKPVKDSDSTGMAQSVSEITFRGRHTDYATEWISEPGPAQLPQEKNEAEEADDDQAEEISVVAVDGCDELRFLALSNNMSQAPMVLRKRACLACCLDVCRETGYKALLL